MLSRFWQFTINFNCAEMKKYLFLASILILAAVAIFQFDFDFVADKFAHAKVSLVIFTIIFATRLTFREHSSEAVALVLALRDTIFVGILKELFDGVFAIGVPEFADLVADSVGIAIPFVGILLVEFFEIGRESIVHSGSRKIFCDEENYFRRQLKILRHSGLRLFYQI